jgi:hypothetical protein
MRDAGAGTFLNRERSGPDYRGNRCSSARRTILARMNTAAVAAPDTSTLTSETPEPSMRMADAERRLRIADDTESDERPARRSGGDATAGIGIRVRTLSLAVESSHREACG